MLVLHTLSVYLMYALNVCRILYTNCVASTVVTLVTSGTSSITAVYRDRLAWRLSVLALGSMNIFTPPRYIMTLLTTNVLIVSRFG